LSRSFGAASLVVASGLLGLGCTDTTPIDVPPKEGGVIDAGGDARARPECHACISAPDDPGPGCGDELAACFGTMYCGEIYECAYALGCVFEATYEDSLLCAIRPCGKINNAYLDSLTAATKLTECFHKACADVCVAQ
jgi:hypothetical protein